MAVFFNGFLAYVREVSSPVFGEKNTGEKLVIPGDDINVAAAVRRITRGELIPMRELTYGVDPGEMDLVDIQQTVQQAEQQTVQQAEQQTVQQAEQQEQDASVAPVNKDDKS